jgi:hypothetical protein
MFYEFTNVVPLPFPKLIGGLLPASEVSLYFWLAGALLLLVSVRGSNPRLGLVAAAVVLAGTYIYSSRWVDEVFINLEHPYNLWHHGRYSASAQRWTDGTVEFLYYLLLTPVAATRATLARGNFALGYVVALGHLALVAHWLRHVSPQVSQSVRTLSLVAFALFVPVVEVCASGFGNGAVSLVVLCSLTWLVEDRADRGLAAAAFLPLLRPDGVVYSGICFAVAVALHRRLRFWPLVCAGSILLYFLLVRITYGHAVPTPLSFKSFHLSMIPLLKDRPWCGPDHIGWCTFRSARGSFFAGWARSLFLSPWVLCAGACMVCARFFDPGRFKGLIVLRLALIPLALLACLYGGIALGYHPALQRYYAPFLVLLFVLSLHYAASVLNHAAGRHPRSLGGLLRLSPLLAVVAFGTFARTVPKEGLRSAIGGTIPREETERLDAFLYAGTAIDELFPSTWRVAVTEMATFSFMNDRDIVDVWGYTNPEIALSKHCSSHFVRNNPAVFMKERPEVMWARTSLPSALYSVMGPPDEFEFTTSIFGKRFNVLGDMERVLDEYDAYKLRHSDGSVTHLLVRKDVSELLQGRMEARGYKRITARSIDRERFSKFYNATPFVERDCS